VATQRTVQNVVWQIELGRGKVFVQWALIVLATVTLALLYTATQFRGLAKREAMDQAQLARNIANGEGYTTHFIRPASLWFLRERGKDFQLMRHPDLVNPPLYPTILAGLFKVAPKKFVEPPSIEMHVYEPERWIIVPFGQLCLVATVLLVWFWTRQIFDRRIAAASGLILLLSDTLWQYAISGLNTMLLMLLTVAAIFLLYQLDRRLNPLPATDEENAPTPTPASSAFSPVSLALIAGSAVLTALAFLTRYTAGVLVLPLALYAGAIVGKRRRWAAMAAYAVAFLVVISPWLARNWQISGTIFGLSQYEFVQRAGPFSGETFERSLHPDFENFSPFRNMAGKFMAGVGDQIRSVRNIGSDFTVFFFFTGLLYGFRRASTARLRLMVVGTLVVLMATVALVGYHPETHDALQGGNLSVILLPFVVVFGTVFFFLLFERLNIAVPALRVAAIGLFVLANISPMILRLLPPNPGPYPYPPYLAALTTEVGSWTEPDEIISSDMPWAMAWYGQRRCVWLPTTVEDFVELHDFWVPRGFSGLFLTPYAMDRPLFSGVIRGEYQAWATLIRSGQLPSRFPLDKGTVLPPYNEQFFLSNRPLWQKAAP
jgi:4-amino-4-deoxy-L-arabinose transferase-like glycosyltransferase